MALGTVSVNNLNLGQGAVTEIERYFLFIGPAAKNVGKLIPLDTQSDLDTELGIPPSDLKTQIEAARLNGGDRWACVAAPIADDITWQEALEAATRTYSVESVVITAPATTGEEFAAMHAAAIGLSNKLGRRVFIMAATPGIALEQTWDTYVTEQKAIVDGLAAPRVLPVPQLHGNNLGVLAGRLANAAVSIADSPMRVATGALVGLGVEPKDMEGNALPSAVLSQLDAARLSVPQSYSDYPGMFWGDGNLLDAPGSDFQVIENLRVVDKAARRVRILLIQRVADRKLNSTPNSMAAATSALMAPLRQMAKSTTFAGQQFPGEIEPPKDGDVTLVWKSKTAVEAYLKLRPYNSPKDLTANIALDLSTDSE